MARNAILPHLSRLAPAAIALIAFTSAAVHADILITEVIPNVTTNATRGDVVELFNSGPDPVDLTGWILTDLDPNPVAGVLQDATFAPLALGLPTLAPGAFAVIDFVDISGTASWQATNYGLRIVAPLTAGSFLGSERDELLLADAAHTPVDFVAWSDSNTTVPADSYQDLAAVTGPTFGYGLVPGTAAWNGPDSIGSDAEYYAATVDFTAFSSVSTWGGGAIRRRSTNGVFDVADPDGPDQWEAVPRHQATLGNASDDVTTGSGLRPLRITDDLTTWLSQIRTSSFPDRRLAATANQNPPSFAPASAQRQADWQDVVALAFAGDWDATFAAANPLGYEVVEFLDTSSGQTFFILRERFVPGEPGFTGMGTYVFYEGPGVRDALILQVPHPIFDSNTLEQGALAAPLVRPRLLMIAGTHRNNHPDDSGCDGTQSGGDPYRISDVAHHPDNLFHATHVWLTTQQPEAIAIQFHGFCCPGSGSYASLHDDCVLSNGFNAPPPADDFTQLWRARIDAQNFLAGGSDLTTAAVFGDDASVLGATTNVQGRISNGVTLGLECNTPATGATGRFIHIEQDPDVRAEPLHILTALIEVLDRLASPCGTAPESGCRQAAPGKAMLQIRDQLVAARDRFLWKWSKGEATDLADFADPLSGSAAYHVCVYDTSTSAQPLLDLGVAPGGLCGTKPCWKATGTKGFAFRDRTAAQAGVTALKLGAGPAGKAKLLAQARGPVLATPALPLVPPVVVQLLVEDGGDVECWQTTYDAPLRTNASDKLRAKQ